MRARPLGSTGLTVSELALGGAALGQQYGPVSQSEGAAAVRAALDAGVTFLDTSAYYGEGASESLLGAALDGVPRDSFVIGTKAGRLGRDRFDFRAAGLRDCLEASLRRLRLDHVDVLLAHDVEFADDFERIVTETADALHRLKAEGKCRAVGMSGYPLALLRRVVERCELDVVMSYCHLNLQNGRLLTELLPAAESRGVAVVNASPLAMGLFAPQGPPPWHPAPPAVKAACAAAVWLMESRGVSPARFALRWCLDQPGVASTVTGAGRPAEVAENLGALGEPLDAGLLAEVRALLAPAAGATWPSGSWPAG